MRPFDLQKNHPNSPPPCRRLKTKKQKGLKISLFASLLAFGLLTGLAFADRYSHLELFAQAFHLIKTHYLKPVDTKKLIYGAIKGLVREVDPHSQFLLPEDLKQLREESKGMFYGLGLQLQKKEGALVVLSVFKGSPAEKSGFKPGDKLLKINQKEVRNFSQSDFDSFLKKRGKKQFKISVLRKGLKAPLEISVQPSPLPVRSVYFREIEKGLFYIRIYWFAEKTALEIQQILKNQKAKGIVLDLRGNPGGLFESSVHTANLFLSQGLIVGYRGKDPSQTKTFQAQRAGTLPPFPLVVLIDEHSASGSEIVAGALKDHQRAFIVGRTSFGKGSVQKLFSLKGQHGLKLTVGEYQTPSGKLIHKQGIEPDIKIEKPLLENQSEGEKTEGGNSKGKTKEENQTEGKKSVRGGKSEGENSKGGNSKEKTKEEANKKLLPDSDILKAVSILKKQIQTL